MGIQCRGLTLIGPVRQNAHGQVGYDVQFLRICFKCLANENGHLMSGITIAEQSCLQIEDTDKHSGEKTAGLIVAKRSVYSSHDGCCLTAIPILFGNRHHVARLCSEQRLDNRHQHSRRHSFSAHITNAEAEPVMDNEEVIKITSHLSGWCQRGIELHVITFRGARKLFGNHGLLNFASYIQFPSHVFLLLICAVQATQIGDSAPNNIGQ